MPTLILWRLVDTRSWFSVAKGKKLHDKRQSLKEKDISRDTRMMIELGLGLVGRHDHFVLIHEFSPIPEAVHHFTQVFWRMGLGTFMSRK